jgi:hypothetical protein
MEGDNELRTRQAVFTADALAVERGGLTMETCGLCGCDLTDAEIEQNEADDVEVYVCFDCGEPEI